MKRIALAAVIWLSASSALANCPEGSTELYYGEEVQTYCYHGSNSALIWNHVIRICLAEESHVIAFEKSEEDVERLVGICRGTFETRY